MVPVGGIPREATMKTHSSILLLCVAGLSLGQAAVGVLYLVTMVAAYAAVAALSLAMFTRLRPSRAGT